MGDKPMKIDVRRGEIEPLGASCLNEDHLTQIGEDPNASTLEAVPRDDETIDIPGQSEPETELGTVLQHTERSSNPGAFHIEDSVFDAIDVGGEEEEEKAGVWVSPEINHLDEEPTEPLRGQSHHAKESRQQEEKDQHEASLVLLGVYIDQAQKSAGKAVQQAVERVVKESMLRRKLTYIRHAKEQIVALKDHVEQKERYLQTKVPLKDSLTVYGEHMKQTIDARTVIKEMELQLESLRVEHIDRERQDVIEKELWDGDIRHPMKQGRVGDCYALAALDSIKNHPNGKMLLLSKVHVEETAQGEASYRVHLYDRNTQTYRDIPVTEKDLLESERAKTSLSGSKGDKIVERAMQRLINEQRDNEAGHTVAGKVYEGGYPWRAYEMLHGSSTAKDVIIPTNNQQHLASKSSEVRTFLASLPPGSVDHGSPLYMLSTSKYIENVLQIAGTRPEHSPNRRQGFGGLIDRVKDRFQPKKEHVVGKHAYCIRRYDEQTNTATIINTHDTDFEYDVPLGQLLTQVANVIMVHESEVIGDAPLRTKFHQ